MEASSVVEPSMPDSSARELPVELEPLGELEPLSDGPASVPEIPSSVSDGPASGSGEAEFPAWEVLPLNLNHKSKTYQP